MRFSSSTLESVVERVARVMSENHGVRVQLRGRAAYVDLETMVIVLPTSVRGLPLLQKYLYGFMYHEVAHVLFTDPEVPNRVREEDPPSHTAETRHTFWNVCEDVWIERRFGGQFLGVERRLTELRAAFDVSVTEAWEAGELGPSGKFVHVLQGAWAGTKELSDYYGDPDVGALLTRVEDLVQPGREVESSEEALAVSDAVLARLCDLSAPPPEDGGAGEEEDPDDEEVHRQATQVLGLGGDDDPEAVAVDLETWINGGRNLPPDLREQLADWVREAAAGGPDLGGDVREADQEQTWFLDWGRDSDPDDYLVFCDTSEEDEVHFTREDRVELGAEYVALRDRVHKFTGGMASLLEMALAVEAESRWVGAQRRGRRFDRRRLPGWAAGAGDDRLFRQYVEGEAVDAAVTLLWDCSGSMGSSHREGSKASIARVAAVAFHEALKRTSVPHEVLGFNTAGSPHEHVRAAAVEASRSGEDLDVYSRVDERNSHYVFVPFGETDGRAIAHITGAGANRDGEAVLWAAKRLSRRPEQRRVLIVGSDGHPQGARYHRTEVRYLQEVVREVSASGIEVYGVGIKDRSVQEFYPEWVVLDRVQDLPRAVVGQLVRSLTARKGTRHGRYGVSVVGR